MRVRPLLSRPEAEALRLLLIDGIAHADATDGNAQSKKHVVKGKKALEKVDAAIANYEAAEAKKKEQKPVETQTVIPAGAQTVGQEAPPTPSS